MRYDLVIFDLDGTILDTLDDLAAAANAALAQGGYPQRTRDEVRRFIGNGVARLMKRALPEGSPDDVCSLALQRFNDYYARHLNDHTVPYDGIADLFASLRGAGVRVAVNSNKPDAAVQSLCRDHFDGLIEMALGERPEIPRKPAPDGARRIMEALGVSAERTLYVGDGDSDILTAEKAGVDGAWVSWGFRRREELTGLRIPHAFDSIASLKTFLLE